MPEAPGLQGSCLRVESAWSRSTVARSVGDQSAQIALVVGRSRGLLVAALGEEWNCWRSMNSLSMILSGDAAMRVEATSSVSSAEGGCRV